MDRIEVANKLVKLYAEYRILTDHYGYTAEEGYSDAVAQAILLLDREKKEGAE